MISSASSRLPCFFILFSPGNWVTVSAKSCNHISTLKHCINYVALSLDPLSLFNLLTFILQNPPAKKSPVWLFFKKICNGRGAQCNSCQTLLKISNNGTTSLLRHLKSKHQLEFEESLRLQNEATEATEATNTLEELVSSTPRHEPDGLQQSTLEMEVIDASK